MFVPDPPDEPAEAGVDIYADCYEPWNRTTVERYKTKDFSDDAAQVSETGKLQLLPSFGVSTRYVDFEFIEGGAERAKEACSKIVALGRRNKDKHVLFPVQGREVRGSIWSNCGLFDEKSKNVAINSLDALTDGRSGKIIDEFAARCETEHPFLSQFATYWANSTPIENVEAVPFAGDDGDCVDPERIQYKPLLDLAKDASAAEFGDPDGSMLLRFHAIVAATPAAPAVSSG